MVKSWTVEIVSLLFVFLFIYTGIYKIIDFQNFKAVIGQSPLITRFAPILAVAVPVTEIAISGLLVIPRYRLMGLCASFVLMLFFTVYIAVLLNLNAHLPCSCGGIIEEMTWHQHLIFNIVFLFLALTGIAMK
jgi:uncharacterized membrane protein YphA (DoxX/SURF4 family)